MNVSNNTLVSKIFSGKNSRELLVCYGLIGLGVIFRLKHYLTNCSLWTDETWVAVSVTSRSLWDIIRAVEIFPDFSKPPLGFLVLTKLATFIFGDHEYALRFFSFLFGVTSLILFYRLLRRFADRIQMYLALAFFSLAPSLIYYSAELKQYALDLALGLWLFLFFGKIMPHPLRFRQSCLVAVVGAGAIWVSNAALFILAAFGLAEFFLVVARRRWRCMLCAFFIYSIWAGSFWLLYQRSLSDMVTNDLLFQSWKGALLEHPVFSFQALQWMSTVVREMFVDPLGFSIVAIAFPLSILGCILFLRKHKEYALLFLCSIGMTFLAAVMHKYPFRGRLLLFLFPCVLIFVIQGLLGLIRSVRKEYSFAILMISILALGASPVFFAVKGLATDYCREHAREAIAFVSERLEPGDFIFVNSAAQFPLWYYGGKAKIARFFPLEWAGMERGAPREGVRIGKFWEGHRLLKDRRITFFRYEYNLYDSSYRYRKSLVRTEMAPEDVFLIIEGMPFSYAVPGKRAWVLLAGASPKFERLVTSAFDLRFPKIAEFKARNVSAYLYFVP